jgi:hypothetical protein
VPDRGTSITLPCHTLGIDLSSRFIDLVLLAENSDTANWTRINLEGATAFERARDVAEKMPQPGWYEAHGVYLIALERPFVRFGQDVIRLVQGCVLGALPTDLPCWEAAVSQWKKHLGIGIRDKPTAADFPGFELAVTDPEQLERDGSIPQDAFDALGIACYARDVNAQAISDALSAA